MLEGVDAIIAYQEAAGETPILSPQAERILGYRCEEIAPFPAWRAATHPDDLPRCRAAWDGAGGAWDLTYRVRRADGAWIWVHDAARRVAPGGSAPRTFGVVTDITGSREASEALRASEERYRLLVDGAVDGILVSDADDRYVEANPAVCRMLGY